jgi:signal transduction histidine kinase
MLRRLQMSIASKVMVLVLGTTVSALALSALGLVAYDLRAYERQRTEDLFLQAEIVGRASAPALSFDDREAAQKDLSLMRVRQTVLAAAISGWLQRGVTGPILEVARVAREVMNRRDYALRARKTSEDEIGELVDAFNGMLAEAGRRAEALREADRRKDEFLATLAHELRNPLAPLRNAVEILRTAQATPEMHGRALDMMERQLRQMVRLVDDLLDVSRITTGKLMVHRQVFDLRAALRDALETVRPFIDSRGHALELKVDEAPLPVDGDEARLAQVIGNLLHNAAKYTEAGGRIALFAERDGDEVVVRVRETGIGLDERSLAAIFEMFVQVDRSLTRTQAGLGVGLTLARRLIGLHDGTITAYSAGLGKGSEFIVRLPLAQMGAADERLEEPDPAMNAASGAGRRRRVLLADDNVDFATSLAAVLARGGHDVRGGASRGRELQAGIRVPRHRHAESARLRARAAAAREPRDPGMRPRRRDRMGPGGRPAAGARGGVRPAPREAGRSGRHRVDARGRLTRARDLNVA